VCKGAGSAGMGWQGVCSGEVRWGQGLVRWWGGVCGCVGAWRHVQSPAAPARPQPRQAPRLLPQGMSQARDARTRATLRARGSAACGVRRERNPAASPYVQPSVACVVNVRRPLPRMAWCEGGEGRAAVEEGVAVWCVQAARACGVRRLEVRGGAGAGRCVWGKEKVCSVGKWAAAKA